MRTRLVVVATAVCASVSLTGTALAHGGGGGHDRQAEHRRGNRFSFEMTGAQVPDGGDRRGAGHAGLTLHPDRDTACLQANWQHLEGEVTAIHVHKGVKGENGPHHVEMLNEESLAGDWNRAEFCVKVPDGDAVHAHGAGHDHGAGPADQPDGSDAIDQILADPDGFYLNIHTTAFPKGALRGQLS